MSGSVMILGKMCCFWQCHLFLCNMRYVWQCNVIGKYVLFLTVSFVTGQWMCYSGSVICYCAI